jgi:hypothetical protein
MAFYIFVLKCPESEQEKLREECLSCLKGQTILQQHIRGAGDRFVVETDKKHPFVKVWEVSEDDMGPVYFTDEDFALNLIKSPRYASKVEELRAIQEAFKKSKREGGVRETE